MKISKLFLNIEHEEKWINDMSAKGYRLVGKNIFSYEFEKNESDRKFRYYVDQRGLSKDNGEFVRFLDELNIRLIKKQLGFYYFEADAASEVQGIYTDAKSKKELYFRCILFLFVIGLLNISIINHANGPYIFNLSIPILVNGIVLLLVVVEMINYLKKVILLSSKRTCK